MSLMPEYTSKTYTVPGKHHEIIVEHKIPLLTDQEYKERCRSIKTNLAEVFARYE